MLKPSPDHGTLRMPDDAGDDDDDDDAENDYRRQIQYRIGYYIV